MNFYTCPKEKPQKKEKKIKIKRMQIRVPHTQAHTQHTHPYTLDQSINHKTHTQTTYKRRFAANFHYEYF